MTVTMLLENTVVAAERALDRRAGTAVAPADADAGLIALSDSD